MKRSYLIPVLLTLLILIQVMSGLHSRQKLVRIENELKQTSANIQTVRHNINLVINSLEKSTSSIKNILQQLDDSQLILDSLIARTSKLSASEKNRIQHTIDQINHSIITIENEKQEAEQLLLLLNPEH